MPPPPASMLEISGARACTVLPEGTSTFLSVNADSAESMLDFTAFSLVSICVGVRVLALPSTLRTASAMLVSNVPLIIYSLIRNSSPLH